MNPDNPYIIDDILGDSPVTRALNEVVPSAQNTFTEGVSSNAVTSGQSMNNVTMTDGFWQSSNYALGSTGWKLTKSSGEFNFPVSVDSIDIPDAVIANSFHVQSDGDTFWGTTPTLFDADNNNAIAYILKTGIAKFQSVILSSNVQISGIANNTGTDLAILELIHDLVFSSSNTVTVAWASGTITMSNGRSFAIDAGTTSPMSERTYIYLDVGVSSTVLQVTTIFSTALGANKRLIAIAQNDTAGAIFQVIGGRGGINLNADSLNVSELAAISANMGAITAGTIALATTGYIRSGQTAYHTGIGWFLGYDGGVSKLSIGDPATNYLNWDGTYLRLKGSFDVGTGGIINNSVYTVANLPAQPTAVGFNVPSANSAY